MPDESKQSDNDETLRIAVLGAGPIGLEAALYGRYLGYTVVVFDPGEICSGLVGDTNQLPPFRERYTPLALAAIDAQNPEFEFPAADDRLTIDQWRTNYFLPLAKTDLVRRGMRLQSIVESIRFDAEDETYELVAKTSDGDITETFDYIIDTRNLYAGNTSAAGSAFDASETNDFLLVSESEAFAGSMMEFDFQALLNSIVRIYASIGERDDLDVYGSMQQYIM